MITFCIGSARQKRAYFAKTENAVILDNLEVLFCASENGKNYFALGSVPFADFTAGEYLRYRRAPLPSAGGELGYFGINENARLKSLPPAAVRCIYFLEKTGGATSKTVVINLDGAKYSRKNAAALKKLLDRCPNAYVLVTDGRFVKKFKPKNIMTFGKQSRTRPAFYKARVLAVAINAKKIAIM